MLNVNNLFATLSSIQSGEISQSPNFNFSVGSFVSDWLSIPTRDWEKSLIYLIEFTEKLISEFIQSESADFKKLSDFQEQFPDQKIHSELDDNYPKEVLGTFEQHIIFSREEEVLFIRKGQSDFIRNDLKKLRITLKECLKKYLNEKDSEIFQPTYLIKERIPFFGNEHQLSYFFKLLIDGGFVLASDTNLETGNVNKSIFDLEFLSSLSDNKLAAFEKHLILKKDLSKRVADYFYCVDPKPTSSTFGFEVITPKQSGISSRMNKSAKYRVADVDIERFTKGFRKILKDLEEDNSK